MITPETYKNENVSIENENRTNMIHSSQLIIVSDINVLALTISVLSVGNYATC